MKTGLIVSKLLRFSRQEWIQKKKNIQIYTEKGKNKNWTDLSLLGQEPTFKNLKYLLMTLVVLNNWAQSFRVTKSKF